MNEAAKTTTNAVIGSVIRAARKAAGLRQHKVAEGLGLHMSEVSRIESGCASASAAQVLTIASMLRVSSGDLMWAVEACVSDLTRSGVEVVARTSESDLVAHLDVVRRFANEALGRGAPGAGASDHAR